MAVPTAQALYDAAKVRLDNAISANNVSASVNWSKIVAELAIVKQG